MFWKRRIYLDQAAGASPNPSSPHEEGRRAKQTLEDARTDIARLMEVHNDDVIFTGGATEANALAILGHVRALRGAGKQQMHLLYLASAHASIVENAKLLAEEGVHIGTLPILDYRVDTAALQQMLQKETVLVSMDAVCGETGVVWNTREVASALRESSRAKRGILLHVDASQAPLTEKISRAHFGADMLTLDASKVGTVRGIGALIAHRSVPFTPLYRGGGQERNLRPGSEAPELAEHFAAALRAAAKQREAFRASASHARQKLIKTVTEAIPDVEIQEGRTQAPHILSISLPGRDTDYLVALLDEEGFAVSTRSACETDSEEGSRAVLALTGDSERARSTLRISWGPGISERELQRFGHVLARSVAFIDSHGGG